MKQNLKNYRTLTLAATLALALSNLLTGCDRTVSKTETTRTSDDGTVKTKEKSVKESPDGTVTKKEESTTTTTNKP